MAAAASSRSLPAATCIFALLFAGCLLAAALPAADARRLLDAAAASPGMAPAPSPGADGHAGGRLLLEGGRRALLDGGLRLAGRLLLGLGL
ncbi:hypothetical protein PVAP13_9NG210400 [Panicum virgatum]|uniref:Uncharacterized protein n=1 Tax=Panicum virgatum TaxID=38727 RepID=A0A8T0MPF1_PANVG|nr:hypothetical protein PVAP13_9NG210400 [Panicum virgatum]